MKIEKINANKIKVLIGNDEAKELNINFKNIIENTPKAQDVFWEALRIAQEEVDFSVNGAKLFVEHVPNGEDGFGMLITRVCNDNDVSRAIVEGGYSGRKIKQTRIKMTDVRGVCAVAEKYIYKFTDFDGVCDAAREIATVFIGKSVLYKACESFYLCLEPIDMYGFVETENILLEFSDKQKNSNIVFGQLCEHGKLMIDNNAVGALFDNFSISK